ncbi:MAG: DUF4926 domain-containing protein [Pseudomonadota bacterium]
MARTPNLFDVVALTEDTPDNGLVAGQVGTVVDIFDATHVLVEFSNDEGEPYALAALPTSRLLVLHYEPVAA